MLETALLLAGLALLGAILVDFVFTTIGASIRPILAGRVAWGAFSALKAAARGTDRAVVHHAAGPLVMVAVAATWILGIWLGWTLVFLSDPASVTWAASDRVAGFWGTLGHAGRQVSTLGSGTTDPEGTVWYVMGVLGAISGMIVMTLGVSFILTTTASVTGGRALCGLSEALDPADPENAATLLPALAEVVAALNSAPFALYYSSSVPTRRLPNRIAVLVQRAASSPRAMRLYRPVLNDLPNLDVAEAMGDEAYARAVEAWSRRYELAPMSPEETRAAAARGRA